MENIIPRIMIWEGIKIVMINLVIFLIVISYVAIWKNYLIGLILILGLMIVDVMGYGMQHFVFLVACELVFVVLAIREIKEKGDNSSLLRFNPLYKNNQIPRGLQLIFLSVFILAFLVQFVALLLPKSFIGIRDNEKERRSIGQMRVNEIIDAYNEGRDYHAVANQKGFPPDKFVDRFIEAMVSEYERLDNLKKSLIRVESLPVEERLLKLRKIFEQSQCECSNIVVRLANTKLGEENLRRLTRQFMLKYQYLNETILDRIKQLEDRHDGEAKTEGVDVVVFPRLKHSH